MFNRRIRGFAAAWVWIVAASLPVRASPPADAPRAAVPSVGVTNAPEWHVVSDPRWVIWRAAVGSRVASPVLTGDCLLVGASEQREGDDVGRMACVAATNGARLWHIDHQRLGSRTHDMPGMPITSQAAVDGNRAYYVSNRGELVCAALRGASDTPTSMPHEGGTKRGPSGGAILWKLDMLRLGVNKVDAPDLCNPICSALVVDDLVYCVTGNGGDFNGLPAPDAPSFIAVNKMSGKLVWSSSLPGKNIVFGQWSSPKLAEPHGHKEILFPGGDGWLYGFEPRSGELLWKIDLGGVPPDGGKYPPRGIGRRNFFVGAPTVDGDTVFVGLGQIPEDVAMTTRRPVYAVELALQDGVVRPRIRWTFDDKQFDGTTAAVAVADGKVYALAQSGVLFALDERTGRPLWTSNLDQQAALFTAPVVHSGRLYVAGEDGELFCFLIGPAPRCLGKYQMGTRLVDSAPVAEGDRIYMAAGQSLWALREVPQ